jgi:hypothetical protein
MSTTWAESYHEQALKAHLILFTITTILLMLNLASPLALTNRWRIPNTLASSFDLALHSDFSSRRGELGVRTALPGGELKVCLFRICAHDDLFHGSAKDHFFSAV